MVEWMPEAPVMLYVRAQARKVGAINIEEDANTFEVTTAHGKTGTIRVPAGRYTGTELATLIESRASKLPQNILCRHTGSASGDRTRFAAEAAG